MEKITNRDFKYFWGPQAIVFGAGLISLMLCWIPVLGPVISILMSIASLLCGLFIIVYRIFFFYQLSLDVNAVCEGDGLETKSYLFVAALNTVTFGLYGKYWIYQVGQRLQVNAPRYGFKMVIGGKEMLVLDILSAGWISAWEFTRNMNKFAEAYNRGGVPEMVGGVQ